MGNLKFGTYSDEEAEKEQDELEDGSADFIKFGIGKTRIRIMPPPVGKRSPFLKVHEHVVKVGDRWIRFACPRLHANQPCRTCKRVDELRATGNDKDEEAAYEISAKPVSYCNAVDRKHPDKGPRFVACKKKVREQLASLRADQDDGGDFSHPIKGYDVIVERKGSTKNDTQYFVRPGKKCLLHEDEEQMAAWLEIARPLDKFGTVMSYKEQVKKLGFDDDDDDDERPKLPRGRRISDDTDDVDEDDDKDDDDDDDSSPGRRSWDDDDDDD